MHEYDIALKELLLDTSAAALRELIGFDIRRWREIELPQVSNPRIDLLGETEDGTLAHIELQSANDAEMGVRMLTYALRIYEQQKRFPYWRAGRTVGRPCGASWRGLPGWSSQSAARRWRR
jgi:hypothetical protein